MRTIHPNKTNTQYFGFKFLTVLILTLVMILNIKPSASAESVIETKVNALLARMTLEEKIGQMTQVDRTGLVQISDLQKFSLGSLLYGGDSINPGTTPVELADFNDRYQAMALKSRLKIPLLIGVDAVHGFSNIVQTVVFPHNIGMGATGAPVLIEKAARVTAVEMCSTGVKWTFAPCVAVARDERWGRTYESFGETPGLPVLLGTAAVKGYQGADIQRKDRVLACAKHYLGDGGTLYGTGVSGGIDQGDVQVTESELRKLYLPPYLAAVKAGVRSVMVSYSSWNGQKLHGNQYLITKLLKEELGFSGFVVSDWKGIEQLPGGYEDQVATAINAGIDMLMVVDNYEFFINTTKMLIKKGTIPMSRVNDAVRRILRVKYELGLFEHSYAERDLLKTVGSKEHRNLARECVRKSLVLLKNSGKVLPLSKKLKHIVVVGKSADNLGYQCGGWTVTWQGGSGNITDGTTILQGIRATVSPQTKVVYSPNGDAVIGADVTIVVVGEKPYAEFKGDISRSRSLQLDDEDRKTISNVKKSGIPMVIVLISGRPMMITDDLNQSEAFIAAWLPGTEGQGVADVLFGDYPPTGRLPCSWPKDMNQIPINVGDPDYHPLFEYGYGLDY